MSVKDDAKRAALNLYPEEWQEFPTGLMVDHNANLRNVAEEVFQHVFTVLQSEEVATGVSRAFLRRHKQWGDDPKFNTASMATALSYVRGKIIGGDV